jgi:DNA repair protein RadD
MERSIMSDQLEPVVTSRYTLIHGDGIPAMAAMRPASVALTICSPPFADLFVYSSSRRRRARRAMNSLLQASMFEPARDTVASSSVELRPYQASAIEEIRQLIREERGTSPDTDVPILVVAPTGAGKTVVFSFIVTEAVKRGAPVLIVAHRRELINQTVAKVIAAGVPRREIGVIMGDDPRRNARALVQIASIDTLRNKPTPPPASVLIIDEAHRALSNSYVQLSAQYPKAIKLGFTATPWRLDGKGLGRMYRRLVIVATVQELIDEGFLVQPRVFTHPSKPDLSKVRIASGGDYDEEELAKAVDKATLIGNLVEHYRQHANGLRAFAFAASVDHSRHIAEAFNDAGIAAEHVDGNTDTRLRDAALDRFRRGETLVLANCGVFTEGTDVPEAKCAILGRPTKSRTLYFQCGGRVLRPALGMSFAIILDHAGCALEHGLLEAPQSYSLDDKPKRRTAGQSEASVRICAHCYCAMPSGTRACPACGYAPPIESRSIAEREGQLVEIRRQEDAAAKELRHTLQAMTVGIDRARKWQPGECNRRLFDRYRKSRSEMTAIELRAVLAYLSNGEFDRDNPRAAVNVERPAWLDTAAGWQL